MIRMDDYFIVLETIGAENTLCGVFPNVKNRRIITADLSPQTCPTSSNAHPYGLMPDRAFS